MSELNGTSESRGAANVGFSGSQSGMSPNQKANLIYFLSNLHCISFSHGDCIGSDAEAHGIAENYFEALLAHRPELAPKIVVYPAINPIKRAYTLGHDHKFLVGGYILDGIIYEQTSPAKYLDRNKRIVETTDILLACPKEQEMTMRSGTWATIRYAWSLVQKTGKKVIVIPPNGKIIEIKE
jgi:hypothetical protein